MPTTETFIDPSDGRTYRHNDEIGCAEEIMPMPDPLVDAVAQALSRDECVRFAIADPYIGAGHHECILTWVDRAIPPLLDWPGNLLCVLDGNATYAYPEQMPDLATRPYWGTDTRDVLHAFLWELALELGDGR